LTRVVPGVEVTIPPPQEAKRETVTITPTAA